VEVKYLQYSQGASVSTDAYRKNQSLHPTYTQVATDVFDWKGSKYLLIVDYYSQYIKTARLSGESSAEVIRHTFARRGIPQVVVSDIGLQFSSIEFCRFTAEYGFTHTTSSPRYLFSGSSKWSVCRPRNTLVLTKLCKYTSTYLQPFSSS